MGIERYVIVDWKVLDILNSWEKNKNAFGKYHHQCLIYARLLQLHMDLDYLPHILIVPISSITGKDVYLALFWDYPEECKQAIESFKWSLTPPKPTMDVRGQRPFLTEGHVDRSLPLRYFLDMDASAGELLDALGLASLKLEIIWIWTLKIQLRNKVFIALASQWLHHNLINRHRIYFVWLFVRMTLIFN